MKVIRQEMTLFEDADTRGRYLQLAFTIIMSVLTTRVKAEWAFYVAVIIMLQVANPS